MTENIDVKKATEVSCTEHEACDNDHDVAKPSPEYVAAVAQEDPAELEEARKKLMMLIRIKCGSLGTNTIERQLKPMVYSMNLADCKGMHSALSKKGVLGLVSMLAKHKRMEKRVKRK